MSKTEQQSTKESQSKSSSKERIMERKPQLVVIDWHSLINRYYAIQRPIFEQEGSVHPCGVRFS